MYSGLTNTGKPSIAVSLSKSTRVTYATVSTIATDASCCGAAEMVMLSVAVNVCPPTVTERLTTSEPAAMATSVAEEPSAATVNVSTGGVDGVLVQVGGKSGVTGVSIGLPFWSRYWIVSVSV